MCANVTQKVNNRNEDHLKGNGKGETEALLTCITFRTLYLKFKFNIYTLIEIGELVFPRLEMK